MAAKPPAEEASAPGREDKLPERFPSCFRHGMTPVWRWKQGLQWYSRPATVTNNGGGSQRSWEGAVIPPRDAVSSTVIRTVRTRKKIKPSYGFWEQLVVWCRRNPLYLDNHIPVAPLVKPWAAEWRKHETTPVLERRTASSYCRSVRGNTSGQKTGHKMLTG